MRLGGWILALPAPGEKQRDSWIVVRESWFVRTCRSFYATAGPPVVTIHDPRTTRPNPRLPRFPKSVTLAALFPGWPNKDVAMRPRADITLASVSFHSAMYLAANYEITRDLSGDVKWVVAQNGPAEELPRFTVLPGPQPPATIPAGNPNIKIASYHHALGLNATLPEIKTRFALFLDPDFFIIPPLQVVTDYMQANDLAFFGAPYAIDPNKPRRQDFPCAFCMFVDTQKVDLKSFDFQPDSARTDIMADTGFHIYTRYAGARHDIALPSFPSGQTVYRHTTRQLSDVCEHRFVKAATDAYFWQQKLFGVHLHMKLHIHVQMLGKYATRLVAKEDLSTVQRIVATARRDWGLRSSAA